MHEKMQDLYTALSKFYVFDKKKYSLDEFFSDIKTFKEKFYVSRTAPWSPFTVHHFYHKDEFST